MIARRLVQLFITELNRGSCPVIPKYQRQLTQNLSSCTSSRIADISRILSARSFASSTSPSELKPKTKEEERLEKAKSKKSVPPPIILLDEKDNYNVMTLEDAGKLAKKKNLHLIEVDSTAEHIKGKGKQVYKLVTQAEFYGEDKKNKSQEKDKKAKDDKTVLLKSKTDEHDVLVKVKSIKKLVEKGHTVRVFIGQAGDQGNPEAVYKVIEKAVKDEPIRIVQKVVRGSQIKFQLMPPKVVKKAPASPAPASSSSESDSEETKS